MKIFLLLLGSFSFFNSAIAQSALVQQENLKKVGENWYSGSVITFDSRYKGMQGSPLLFTDWLSGSLHLTSDTIITPVSLKYDVLAGKIYRQTSGENANLILNSRIKAFTLENKKFIRVTLKTKDGDLIEGYAESLSKGKLNLIAIPVCRIRKSDRNNVYGTGRQYDEYIHSEKLYIYAKGSTIANKVTISKKFFLTQMQKKEDDIRKYFKYHKPYLKEKKELKMLVNFYNQLK